MLSNPIAIFAMIAIAGLALFLGAYQFRRTRNGRTAGIIGMLGAVGLAAVAWLWPAVPTVDRSLDEGVPMVDAARPVETGDISPAPPIQLSTQEYIRKVAAADLFETQSGDLAKARGQSSSIRQFAEQMAKEHRTTSQQLKQAIAQAGLDFTPPSLDAHQEAMLIELQGSSGEAFDAIYNRQQIAAHEGALKLNRAYAAHGENETLKSLATAFASKNQGHLTMARTLKE